MIRQKHLALGSAAVAVLGGMLIASQGMAQTTYMRADRPMFPFVSSIDAPMTYGAYTEGPGFFYWKVPAAGTQEEQLAYIHVRVTPPHAEISFEGAKTTQIGSSRVFVSPPLVLGRDYNYTIRVSWVENGKVVTQDRVLPVHAGDRLSIAFRAPAAAPATSELRTTPAK
ncbi:MAG TPA: TIGR03000 domain-containing protein [Gemmataceae bacterium]|nr:TIGR03000 domain-containing protein [Gemmataceae bacterium]